MMQKSDIQTREDIHLIVRRFYEKALTDEVIGYFFTEIVPLNMETHIPKITDFWESILLQGNSFQGNPMKAHLDINAKENIRIRHLERWLMLFHETVDELFAGKTSELAKVRAQSIATVMNIKFIDANQNA